MIKEAEIKYWCFVELDGEPVLLKVEILKFLHDKVTRKLIGAKVKGHKTFLGRPPVHIFNVEWLWQLQDTLEDAKRVMIMGVFKGSDAFFKPEPPWEK
jgi:hypothetical protein